MDYTDPQARQRALDPTQSFIVQAPAGSGKTELLTQRFLKLLVTVSSPEEIIAITFTRKAAAEMRHRILSALNVAASGITPSEPHKQTTFALATQALQQDAQHQWHLLDNPNRLRILTIDALAGFLSAQIPILAGFGSKPDIDDDVGSLYQEAARELVSGVGQDTPWQAHLDTLLLHLDNQTQRVVSLLCSILAKREQWLPHVLSYHGDVAQLHQHLEQGLQAIAEDAIQDLVTEIDPDLLNSLCSLAYTAANNLQADGIAHPFIETPRPPASIDALALWKSLPELLLTQKNTWRKSITKRQGFPAKSDEKAQITHVLEQLTDHEGARDALTNLRFCPGLTYPAAQQSMIDALTQLLPILYAQLRLVFQSKGTIDFVELNLAALRALGEEDEPTDLALYLDYQIKHLLIDEFQDTSITQYSLLQRLTRGWEPDDGRSLFLVGDPMQSIYRFRDAEVGLFLRTEQHGINDIHLEKLTLHHNYRSDKTIIDWINTTFVSLFPAHADISQGSVSYAPSLATRESQTQGVCSYALHDQTKQQEAQCIIEIIRQLQQQPDTSIAILVRSRHHLSEITRALQQHQVAYQAVDLQTLADCSTVQDLVTLTRALLHRFDHIAWYALLRSPICGLTLHDLHALSAHIDNGVWHALSQHANTLSTEGQQRAARVITVLTAYFLEQGRKPFELALEGVWRTLGGNDIATPQQRRNAARYFMLVADLVATHTTLSIDHLTQQLAKTYIEPEKTQSNLSIMTIHKSKGLEFDHVIIPGLQASTSNNTHDLMLWLERPNRAGSIDLILAPIKQATKDKDAIYHYVQRIEKKKLDHELTRLLYVAATRAKKSLHLTACIDTNQDG
ncbi:MAG: ATP-dependent helicase, partial [Coxiella sp. (in: Bacteria)]